MAIHVPDLSKAEEFYTNIPGFELLSKSDEMLEFDTGSLRLYIKPDSETGREGKSKKVKGKNGSQRACHQEDTPDFKFLLNLKTFAHLLTTVSKKFFDNYKFQISNFK